MARPLRVQYPGAYYHITSRGNEKQAIFTSQEDRERFLTYLESSVVRYGAVIHVWCLMDSHYHLFLETPAGNLSQIMRHLNGAYTTYFNVRQKRVGHLFQGRYKAILVEADQYAVELSRYIHLNPVRAGMVDRPENYPWSSYQSYIGQSMTPSWLKTDLILGYFGGKKAGTTGTYQEFVESLLQDEYDSPLQAVVASTLLGSPRFVREISERHLSANQNSRDVPAARELARRPSMDGILQTIEVVLTGERLAKNIGIYCCQKYSGEKLKEIGKHFGTSDAAVSQTSRRLALHAEKDSRVKELVERVESALGVVRC